MPSGYHSSSTRFVSIRVPQEYSVSFHTASGFSSDIRGAFMYKDATDVRGGYLARPSALYGSVYYTEKQREQVQHLQGAVPALLYSCHQYPSS